jgi:hypothetical protein
MFAPGLGNMILYKVTRQNPHQILEKSASGDYYQYKKRDHAFAALPDGSVFRVIYMKFPNTCKINKMKAED